MYWDEVLVFYLRDQREFSIVCVSLFCGPSCPQGAVSIDLFCVVRSSCLFLCLV